MAIGTLSSPGFGISNLLRARQEIAESGLIDEDSLEQRKAAILPHLDERQRRLFAAAEAKAAGYGGIAAVSRVTRIAASTIGRGLKEFAGPMPPLAGRVRRPGGGRKSLSATDPRLLEDLNGLVDPSARGDPRLQE